MMKKLIRSQFIFTLVLLCTQAIAKNDAPLQVQFKHKSYELTFSDDQLLAKNGKDIIKGEREKQIGDFSQWEFKVNDQMGFEIILNQKTDKILSQKNSLDAEGPFLVAASPDSNYVVFDYGSAATRRDFEVKNADGKVVFKKAYLNQLDWTKDGLEYDYPVSVPITLNKETEACRSVGVAWKTQMYLFDGKENKKLTTAPRIQCSN